ncbi:MAG: VWA domain-containing protein [Acidobacteria bacterium]|nr:VWA domain-containing protein [Acidobacteriota bacterium]
MQVQNALKAIGLLVLLLGCKSAPTAQNRVNSKTAPQVQEIQVTPISLEGVDANAAVSLARNIYFIFDGSGSMYDPPGSQCGSDNRFRNKLEGAQWAVTEFLKSIPDDINIGLFVFDNNGMSERVPLGTSNREAFLAAIQNVRAGGGTPLYEAMRTGTQQLVNQYRNQLGYGEYRLVVVTDGIASNIAEASVNTLSKGIPIYAIGLCVESNHPLRQYATSYRSADNFEALQKGLEETLAELPSFDPADFEAIYEESTQKP